MNTEELLKKTIAEIIDKLEIDPFRVVAINPDAFVINTESNDNTMAAEKAAQVYFVNYSGKPYPVALEPEDLECDVSEAMRENNALPANLIGCFEEEPIYFINAKTGKATNGFLLVSQIYIEGHGFDDLTSPLEKISEHICNGSSGSHEQGLTYEYKFSIGMRFKTSEEILNEIL